MFAPKGARVEQRADGTLLLESSTALGAYRRHICEYLRDWAEIAPDRTFIAERAGVDGWQHLTYGDAWRRSCSISQSLLSAGYGPEDSVAILTGNSISHALLMFASMLAGIPAAPISPSYSQSSQGLPRLQQILAVLQPTVVFVEQASLLDRLGEIKFPDGALILSTDADARTHPLSDLEAGQPTAALWKAYEQQDGDSVGKILFTSGSTGLPKGVLNTQRMLCSGQRAAQAVFPELPEPSVIVDWLPWHHTMGGNANLHGALREGGTLYIDDGRPLPEAFGRTLRNLKELKPTSVLNVPAAWQMLATALEQDVDLRRAFFSRMTMMSYAGASLSADAWRRIKSLALSEIGHEIAFGSSYGTTETSPGIATTHWIGAGNGDIGSPFPGTVVKMVPHGDRYEVRVRGPNVTPGYLRRPDLTALAFDEEGFYRTGDATVFVNPDQPADGLRFAGRLSENFKMSNGSWVLTGDLRVALLSALGSLARDLVIAGHDRDDIRILIWPNASKDDTEADHGSLREQICGSLRAHNESEPAQTRRIAAFCILREPASLAKGEITDKGYVNQRAVLDCRCNLVAELYQPEPPGHVALVC